MQTFLPYEDFEQSAKCLDKKRCFKQGVETLQLCITLFWDDLMSKTWLRNYVFDGKDMRRGWENHPATRMWSKHPWALVAYGKVFGLEIRRRGIQSRLYERIAFLNELEPDIITEQAWLKENGYLPPWLGDPAFHRSHRSNLLRKDADYYGPFWKESDSLPYIWPET